MSDGEMERVDEALAAVFRTKRAQQSSKKGITFSFYVLVFSVLHVFSFLPFISDEVKTIVHFKLRYTYTYCHIHILPYSHAAILSYCHTTCSHTVILPFQSTGSGSDHSTASPFQSSHPGQYGMGYCHILL